MSAADIDHDAAPADLVLEELNHRFLNSLQIIATLAAVSPRDGPVAPAIGAKLTRLRGTIGALGRLHRLLARPAPPFEDGCIEACGALTEAFGRCVSLTVDVEDEPDDPALSRGMLLLLTELVTNALKHGRGERLGLAVSLARERRGWRLRVESDAPGRPGRPKVATALAEWLGGELSVVTDAGFAVSVAMPARARAALADFGACA